MDTVHQLDDGELTEEILNRLAFRALEVGLQWNPFNVKLLIRYRND